MNFIKTFVVAILVFMGIVAGAIFIALLSGLFDVDENLKSMFLGVSIVTMILMSYVTYALTRKSKKNINIPNNAHMKKFAVQKRKFQIGAIAIFSSLILFLPLLFIDELLDRNEVVVFDVPLNLTKIVSYIIIFLSIAGYIGLGHIYWRCPACGFRISFLNKRKDRSSIEFCPECNIRLQ